MGIALAGRARVCSLRLAAATAVFALGALLMIPDAGRAAYPTATSGRIAFQAQGTTGSDIWLMNADGSGKANVTNDAQADFDPAVSPNGKLIVFGRDSDPGSDLNSDIYTMNIDGSGLTDLPPERRRTRARRHSHRTAVGSRSRATWRPGTT
jgi:WD40-like Beta Propeller Repeat